MQLETLNAQTLHAQPELAGTNCMEILLFSLGTRETFGINVLKVREICKSPPITRAPNMAGGVEGLVSLRGNVIPVLSLVRILGLESDQPSLGGTMMVAEYSKRTLGFLVESVDRIIRVEWNKVRAPEGVVTSSQNAAQRFITAITNLPTSLAAETDSRNGRRLASILDVEQIMANTFGETPIGDVTTIEDGNEYKVFFVDDSFIARKRISEVLDRMGLKHKHALNGMEAWTRLSAMASHAQQADTYLADELDLILLDAEMPEMDGYLLTSKIKNDPRFNGIPVVMHSSLSSEANRVMGNNAGVDAYVAKFDPETLATTVYSMLMKARE